MPGERRPVTFEYDCHANWEVPIATARQRLADLLIGASPELGAQGAFTIVEEPGSQRLTDRERDRAVEEREAHFRRALKPLLEEQNPDRQRDLAPRIAALELEVEDSGETRFKASLQVSQWKLYVTVYNSAAALAVMSAGALEMRFDVLHHVPPNLRTTFFTTIEPSLPSYRCPANFFVMKIGGGVPLLNEVDSALLTFEASE